MTRDLCRRVDVARWRVVALLGIVITGAVAVDNDETILFQPKTPTKRRRILNTKCNLLRSLNLSIAFDLDGHGKYPFTNQSNNAPVPIDCSSEATGGTSEAHRDRALLCNNTNRSAWFPLGSGDYFALAPRKPVCTSSTATGSQVCFYTSGDGPANWEIIECIVVGSWLRAAARRSSAEHLIATKALRLHSYGLDDHCRWRGLQNFDRTWAASTTSSRGNRRSSSFRR